MRDYLVCENVCSYLSFFSSQGEFKRCGYEAVVMILQCDLKEAMQLDCCKDMPVHVSTCTSYDFSALMPVVWKSSR
jgi:hypothetical protein